MTVIKIELGNITVKVFTRGFQYSKSQHSSSPHNHGTYEFHFVMYGSTILETEKTDRIISEKESVLITPGLFHRFKNNEKGAAVFSFSFTIEKNKKTNCTDYDIFLKEKLLTNKDIVILPQNQQIEDALLKISSFLYSKTMFAEDYRKTLFTMLIIEIISSLSESESNRGDNDTIRATRNAEPDARVYIIEEYFNEFYMNDISLSNLSETLFLSKKQTEKTIKKTYGEGFSDHLCKTRLAVAKNLLTSTDLSVCEIAEKVGYRSYNGFYQAFKTKIGETPLAYRESKKNKSLHD